MLFGIIASSALDEPLVSVFVFSGNATSTGEKDLTTFTIDRGTAVYTTSTPDRNAAIDARIGAP
jgi:hypothetical protein